MPGGSSPAPSARRRPRPRAAHSDAVTVPARSPSSRPVIRTMTKYMVTPGERTPPAVTASAVISAMRPPPNTIAANRVRPDRLIASTRRPRPMMKPAAGAARERVPGCMVTIGGRKPTAMSRWHQRPGGGCERAVSAREWQRSGGRTSAVSPSSHTEHNASNNWPATGTRMAMVARADA